MCKQHYTVNLQAEHQIVYEVFKDIQSVYLRGYIIAQLSYMILALREKGTYTIHTSRHRNIYEYLSNCPVHSQCSIKKSDRNKYNFNTCQCVFHIIYLFRSISLFLNFFPFPIPLEKYRKESQNLRDDFIKQRDLVEATVGEVLAWASRDVSVCSPDNYLYGE